MWRRIPKAVWDSSKTGIDKTTAPADTTQFCPVEGGNFAEKGARMVIMFRLAKMICKDGHWLHIRLPKVLGGGFLPVDGMMEGSSWRAEPKLEWQTNNFIYHGSLKRKRKK
jgi:hypothetical protein